MPWTRLPFRAEIPRKNPMREVDRGIAAKSPGLFSEATGVSTSANASDGNR
jgi:hypothetical protein